MRPELAALVDWLHESGRKAEVNYPRLVHQVDDLLGHAAFIAHDRYDLDRLACATEGVQTHLEATVRDQDAVALTLLLEALLALARFVGENSERLLVATGVLTDEEDQRLGRRSRTFSVVHTGHAFSAAARPVCDVSVQLRPQRR